MIVYQIFCTSWLVVYRCDMAVPKPRISLVLFNLHHQISPFLQICPFLKFCISEQHVEGSSSPPKIVSNVDVIPKIRFLDIFRKQVLRRIETSGSSDDTWYNVEICLSSYTRWSDLQFHIVRLDSHGTHGALSTSNA